MIVCTARYSVNKFQTKTDIQYSDNLINKNNISREPNNESTQEESCFIYNFFHEHVYNIGNDHAQ